MEGWWVWRVADGEQAEGFMFGNCAPPDLGYLWSIGTLDGFWRVMMGRIVVRLREKYTLLALGLEG